MPKRTLIMNSIAIGNFREPTINDTMLQVMHVLKSGINVCATVIILAISMNILNTTTIIIIIIQL